MSINQFRIIILYVLNKVNTKIWLQFFNIFYTILYNAFRSYMLNTVVLNTVGIKLIIKVIKR